MSEQEKSINVEIDVNIVATVHSILRVCARRGAFEVGEFATITRVNKALEEALAPYAEEDADAGADADSNVDADACLDNTNG